MPAPVPPTPEAERTKPQGLTRWLRLTRSADPAERNEAFAELYASAAGSLKPLIRACQGRADARAAVTEAFDDAFAALFEKWAALGVTDTEHFRALVVRTTFWKVSEQRRAACKRLEAVTARVAAPDLDRDDGAFKRFEGAVEELAAFERGPGGTGATPLADAVTAHFLIVQAEGKATFRQVGAALGVGTATAHDRCWAGWEWLHARRPDAVPQLPARKRSGRKPNGNGGAE